MSFRDNLQSLRAERNMTQEQLAMLLGVSRQSVTKWEAEKSYPEMDKLIKLCEIFDCSLDDLVKGDLTGRASAADAPQVPAGPPTDVCGYDEHQHMMAQKVPLGIACIIVGVAIALFIDESPLVPAWGGKEGLVPIIIFAGVLAGLAFLVPAGMAHSAFVKAHPYVEDFYTEKDREQARRSFATGLVAGIGCIFAGVACLIALEEVDEGAGLFLLMALVALGTWVIVRRAMLLGRTNVSEYNRDAVEELEIEDIASAQLSEERREVLLAQKRRADKRGAVCGAIMIAATIVGLTLLFVPVFSTSNLDGFDPLGTSAAWFWVAWPVGGMLCGIVTLLWDAFGTKE